MAVTAAASLRRRMSVVKARSPELNRTGIESIANAMRPRRMFERTYRGVEDWGGCALRSLCRLPPVSGSRSAWRTFVEMLVFLRIRKHRRSPLRATRCFTRRNDCLHRHRHRRRLRAPNRESSHVSPTAHISFPHGRTAPPPPTCSPNRALASVKTRARRMLDFSDCVRRAARRAFVEAGSHARARQSCLAAAQRRGARRDGMLPITLIVWQVHEQAWRYSRSQP